MNLLFCRRKCSEKSTAIKSLVSRLEIEIQRTGYILDNYIFSYRDFKIINDDIIEEMHTQLEIILTQLHLY